MPIPAGISAPDFILADDNGAQQRLSDYRGQPLILYFYPKDDTPGCTLEACNFRDDYSAYIEAGVAILGVSPGSSKSYLKFKTKYQLPFPLLADEDHAICEQYGVWGEKQFMGRNYMGVLRTTFLIDPNGKIKKVFEKVKPADHSAQLLAAIKA